MSKKNSSDHEINKVALKLFLFVTDEWGLTDDQRCILSGLSDSVFARLNQAFQDGETIEISTETLERLSLIASIYKELQELFADESQLKDWIHKSNSRFNGMSAINWMLEGDKIRLADVLLYLKGQKTGPYF
ncbi:MAG: hypothetical protein MI976_16075 [Pseudomonadales bacterium]|nr:hypothetical protein [Pseudomonadales bacterium]